MDLKFHPRGGGNAGLTASTERTAWTRSSNVEMGLHGQSYYHRRFDHFIVIHLHSAHQRNNLYEHSAYQLSKAVIAFAGLSKTPIPLIWL